MALLDVQRRGQQIGRLRIGEAVVMTGDDGQPLKDRSGRVKTKPVRLDTFRFTTQSRYTADAIAELYGGTVQLWNGEYEVYTTKSEIYVTIPPRDEIVTQWYEMWSKGGCARRCDSQIEKLSGRECLCPHAEDPEDPAQVEAAALERARLSKLNPPQACSPITRISVMIPDLPGLGIFRLDTKSYWAAVEIGDAAAVMQVARERGVFLPATLRIEHRQRVAGGRTKRFAVPVLEVLATFREIASGALEAGGVTAQLPPAPGEQRRALTAALRPSGAASVTEDDEPPFQMNAQTIADLAKRATTRAEIEDLDGQATRARCEGDLVHLGDDVYEELKPFLRGRWQSLPPDGGGR